MLAAGIGSLVFGLLTTLAQVSPAVRNALQFYQPAGQITGLTTLSVTAWLISWYILFRLWKEQQVPFPGVCGHAAPDCSWTGRHLSTILRTVWMRDRNE
jgi:hypothetical protein